MNILVTGANGQLGSEIKAWTGDAKDKYIFTDVAELDITSKVAVENYVVENSIGLIINCAAYTAVDKAEDDEQLADAINHLACKYLAEVSAKSEIPLIHVSTDYVFDGSNNTPYTENESTAPLGVYGITKLAGEKAIETSGCSYLIFRTSWLYSIFGNNFVKTIRRLGSERSELNVVFDQVGTPTNAADLAELIVQIVSTKAYDNHSGIYHFSNEGVCSWYDFAREIVAISKLNCDVKPCHSSEFPAKVTRPSFSVLDKTKVKRDFNVQIPYWKDSLVKVIDNL